MKTKTIAILTSFIILIAACKKPSNDAPQLEYGSMTDVCGNTYKTVKIGNHWWMAEDLRTTKFRDSSYIHAIGSLPADTTWKLQNTAAFCRNADNAGNIIGEFYNYYAVTDARNLAPQGWHIASDAEWKEMEIYLGMSPGDADNTGWRGTHEGEKLKVVKGTINGWSDYGIVWATNESGFSAMGYGCRMFDGTWGTPGLYSTNFWWTTTATTDGNHAFYRYLDYKNANVFRYYGDKRYGFSVRCVKD
jgi:uncharacterized protein (TIGR02145 family)